MKNLVIISLLLSCPILCAEWNIRTPQKDIPDTLEGTIFGKEFKLGSAEWDDVSLTISSKGKMGHWPESELMLFIEKDAEQKEWYITPDNSDFNSPHIHMKFGKEGADFPGTLMFTGEYSMYLKIIEKTKKNVKLQIHVSLPDYKKSTLLGTFTAKLK
jgi:hypothetical protein